MATEANSVSPDGTIIWFVGTFARQALVDRCTGPCCNHSFWVGPRRRMAAEPFAYEAASAQLNLPPIQRKDAKVAKARSRCRPHCTQHGPLPSHSATKLSQRFASSQFAFHDPFAVMLAGTKGARRGADRAGVRRFARVDTLHFSSEVSAATIQDGSEIRFRRAEFSDDCRYQESDSAA